MDITIFIIIAIAFLIIGFLVGNLFPVLSNFLNAEEKEEMEKEEASEGAMEENDSDLPEPDLPEPDLSVTVEITEPTAVSASDFSSQPMVSSQVSEPLPQAEQPEPTPTSLVADVVQVEVEAPEPLVPEEPLMEEVDVPEKAPRQRPTFGLVDVMHIWRDEKTKELVVEFDERVVRPSDNVNNEEHGELAKLLIDLNDWVGLEAQMEAMERYQKERKKGLAPGSVRDYSKKKATEDDGEPKPIKPRVGLMEMFVRAIQTDVNAPLPEGLVSIVEQINYVLQEKLEGTPYTQRGIELQELPGQGMLFVVGLEKYHEIGEIPDEGIQTIIRSAVAEWEQRVAEQDEE